MTNREWLASLSNKDLSNWLTNRAPYCNLCEHKVRCYGLGFCNGTQESWLKWLEAEHEEDEND